MADIPLTLTFLRPGELWTLEGDDYSGLTWKSETKKPTKAEIEGAWPAAQQAALDKAAAQQKARNDAIAHAKSLGFTDEMIAVMYPNLAPAS